MRKKKVFWVVYVRIHRELFSSVFHGPRGFFKIFCFLILSSGQSTIERQVDGGEPIPFKTKWTTKPFTDSWHITLIHRFLCFHPPPRDEMKKFRAKMNHFDDSEISQCWLNAFLMSEQSSGNLRCLPVCFEL